MESTEQQQRGLASASETNPQASTPKSLCEMPPDVLMHIALALPCREFARMLQTSRYIHDTINTHWIWHQRFTTRFGQTVLEPLVYSRTPTPPPLDNSTLTGDEHVPSPSSIPSSPTTENPHIHTEGGQASEAMKPAVKGRHRKVDLRKTTEVSKDDLVALYEKYARVILPAEDMDICHMGDRYWKMIEHRSSLFGKLAELRSVWWMDVAAVFHGVPPGRYRIQWRLSVTSDAPVVNSEFRVVLFDKDESTSNISTHPEAIMFKPRTVQEFTEQTDSKVTKADRKPFRNLFRGFTTLELPADLVIDEDFQNVYVQIRNHEGWKSGLYIDYVRLVDLDDPVRSKDRISSRTEDTGFNVDEPVNDEGEEYYPSSNSWLGNALGVHLNITNNNRGPSRLPGGARSRAFRHVARLSDASAVSLSPTASAPSSPHLSATNPGNNNNNQPSPGSWYKLFAFLVIYCVYVFWTQ
ncbi:hypothetical protein BGZ52_004560 [Haplosporangium bisporale]|nr:hypothetical protein BGZ52_004560 [Haplosporangium bisporale]